MTKEEEFKIGVFGALDEFTNIKSLIVFQSFTNLTVLRETVHNGYSLTDEELSGFDVLNTMITDRLNTFQNKMSEIYQSINQ
jgi:hypothetical protein